MTVEQRTSNEMTRASGGNRMSRADSNQFALGWLWGIASSAIIVLLIAVLRSCKP